MVRRFIEAFNRGEGDVLDRLFAPEPDFEWYSTEAPGERFREAAYDRSSLVDYFARRHARGERLRLRSFRFNGNTDAGIPYGNFEYSLLRSADELGPTRYHGKGAARCLGNGDVIFVWAMGRG